MVSLRIKCQKGTNFRLEAAGSMLLTDFVAKLEKMTEVPANSMALLKGFPPKRIAFDVENGTVNDLQLQSQDTLIVELDKNVKNTPTAEVIKPSPPSIPVAREPRLQERMQEQNPHSTSSFYSVSSSESTVVPQLEANLPPYFLSSSPDSNFQDVNPTSDSERFAEVPLSSVRSVSNIHNQMLTEEPMADTTAHGILMRHVVPADNSCLFTSVAFCLSDIERIDDVSFLRQLIAATVESDPNKYTEAFLGRPNTDYCNWIKQPDSWGGGIEVSILAEFYGHEITVINIQSLSISRFGEDHNYPQRMFLLYDGIHYDPLYMEIFHLSQQRKLFATSDSEALDQALQLAAEAKNAHQYTDVKNFQLRCSQCNKLLKGNAEAQEHASATGHCEFAEIV